MDVGPGLSAEARLSMDDWSGEATALLAVFGAPVDAPAAGLLVVAPAMGVDAIGGRPFSLASSSERPSLALLTRDVPKLELLRIGGSPTKDVRRSPVSSSPLSLTRLGSSFESWPPATTVSPIFGLDSSTLATAAGALPALALVRGICSCSSTPAGTGDCGGTTTQSSSC